MDRSTDRSSNPALGHARTPARETACLVVSLAVGLLVLLGLPSSPAWAQVVNRVTLTADGAQSNGDSRDAVISADGRIVAFDSMAANLVPGCTDGLFSAVLVHDRMTRQTTCASVASGGTPGNGWSINPGLSADGRFVVFQSTATNLVPGVTSGVQQVYLHDRVAGTTRLVSTVSGQTTPGDDVSGLPRISADGTIVAFASLATNLDPLCTNGTSQIFVHDVAAVTTRCESFGLFGAPDGSALISALSADGRFLAFDSLASNLTGECGFFLVAQIYLIDRVADTIECISKDAVGDEGVADSGFPAVSNDGQNVVFTSAASNLAAPCTNGFFHVLVRDRRDPQLQTTTCITTRPDGAAAAGDSDHIPSISADGRFVTFNSVAPDLVSPPVSGGFLQVYVHDRRAGTMTLLSTAADGTPGTGDSFLPSVSGGGDARFAAFGSNASNLLAGDTNGFEDSFVARLAVGPNWLVAVPGSGEAPRVRGFDALGSPTLLDLDLSLAGGARVALGDVNGDGAADLIVGAGPGADPGGRVRVFAGSTADRPLADFQANPGAPGGATVAACDFDANVRAEIVTGPGSGGGTLVRLWRFDPATSGGATQVLAFSAYDTAPGGINVACGDLDGGGRPSIVTGPGPGSPPLVKVFTVDLSVLPPTATERTSFLAYPDSFTGGVSVAVGDVRRRGRGSIITGPGPGFPPLVRVWTLSQPATKAGLPALAGESPIQEEMSLMPFPENSLGGVNVGAGDTTGTGGAMLLAAAGPGSEPRVDSFDLGGSSPQPGPSVMAGPPDFRGGVLPAAPPVTAAAGLPPSTSTMFFLVVTKVGAGGGTVGSTPAGINCGGTCAGGYERGIAVTLVTLTAQAAAGSVFGGWSGCDAVSGADCTVNLGATRFVTAIFNPGSGDTAALTLDLNQSTFQAGQTMVLTATLTPGATPQLVDAYIVIRLADGSFLSLLANGQAVPGIQPIATAFTPFAVGGDVIRYTFTGGEPPGVYTWFAALTQAGTTNVLGAVDQEAFTVAP